MRALILDQWKETLCMVRKTPHSIIDQQPVLSVSVNQKHVRETISIVISDGSSNDSRRQLGPQKFGFVLKFPFAIVDQHLPLPFVALPIRPEHLRPGKNQVNISITIQVNQINTGDTTTDKGERVFLSGEKIALAVIE